MKRDTVILTIFLGIQVVLYLGFLWMDIGSQSPVISTSLKFLGIVLCFFYALYHMHKRVSDSILIVGAIVFTLCADICLLLTNYYTMGLVFFNIVQAIYLYRIVTYGRIKPMKHLLFRIISIGVVLLVLQLGTIDLDVLLIITVIYFVNITINTITALALNYKSNNKKWLLFSIGMLLFLLCDINVGIYNSSAYLVSQTAIYDKLYHLASLGMWFFYLPAQIFIVMSSGITLKHKNNKSLA